MYPTEFLNKLEIPELPQHKLIPPKLQLWPIWTDKILKCAIDKGNKWKVKSATIDGFKINSGIFSKNDLVIICIQCKNCFSDNPEYDLKVLDEIFSCLSKKEMTDLKLMEEIVRYIKYGDNVMDNVRKVASTIHPLLFVATTGNNIPFRYYVSVYLI